MKNQVKSSRIARGVWLAPTLLLLGAVAQLFLSGNNGCGTKEQQTTMKSPVQALGNVLEHADGKVDAELVLISTIGKTHVFIETATNVQLAVDGTTVIDLPKAGPGRWAVSSTGEPRLKLEAGTRYQFRFDLDDRATAGEMAGGHFVGEVVANGAPSQVTPTSEGYANHTLDVTFLPAIRDQSGSARRGILYVFGPDGSITFRNFDLTHPQFDGSKHARLIAGDRYVLPDTAFPVSGDYLIRLYTVSYVAGFDPHKSAELGLFSGFLAGPASEVSVNME
ncbi:MAG: hypothetical protein FJ125_17255 [Deltaproteobacteria bacterium]|nr:hypothetical protein [Deltaproteobacteria bacterium]